MCGTRRARRPLHTGTLRLACRTLTIGCFWAAASPAHGQTPADATQPPSTQEVHFDVKERTLDNGVRVLVLERSNHAGRIAARVFYQSDMAGERPGTVGLTHMLEHHLFKGSHHLGSRFGWDEERPVAERVERTAREMEDEKNRLKDCFRQREILPQLERECRGARLDSLTAEYEAAVREHDRHTISQPDRTAYMAGGATGLTASTGRDWMKYHADLPAHRLELFMWIERSRVHNPVFRQFDPEKQVVVEQIRRQFNRPDGAFDRALRSLTYEAHPYGWAHWFSDLESATREDHWEIYHKFFTPQNTILVVVGDIGAEEVFRLAERYWGDWPPTRPAPRLRTVEPPPAGERRLTTVAQAGPALGLNVPIPAVGHPDLPALEVLAELLGGRDGLVVRTVNGDTERIGGASASVWVARYPSHFSLRVPVRSNEDLTAVEVGLVELLEEIARSGRPDEEIQAAARSLTFRFLSEFEDPGDAAVNLGAFHAIYDWRLVNELPDLWEAVTADDLARVARDYFHPHHRVVGILRRGDPKTLPRRVGGEEVGFRVEEEPGAGRWPVGGPVEEFRYPLETVMPRAVGRDTAHLPARAEDAADRFPVSSELEPSPAGEPLAVAEHVWYAPPWMAVRRGILDDSRTERPRAIADIDFPEAPIFVPPSAEEYRLPEHLPVPAFLVPDSSLPLVRASIMVNVGPFDDPVGREGMSLLLSELMADGGTAELSRREVQDRLDALGVTLELQRAPAATRDTDLRARIDLLAPPDAAGEALSLLGGRLAHLGRTPDDFTRARSRVAARAASLGDDPWAQAGILFDRLVYGQDHPIARRPTRSSVEAIDREALLDFSAAHLNRATVTLALAGAVDRVEAVRWIQEALRDLPTGSRIERGPVPEPRNGFGGAAGEVAGADRVTVQAFVKLGMPLPGDMLDDQEAFELVNYILCGAGQGSRLFQKLRTEEGWTAAVWCEADPRPLGPTTYELRFAGHPETIVEAIHASCQAYADVRDQGISSEELERARTAFLEGHVPSMYRTAHHTALRFAHAHLLDRYDYVRSYYLNYYAGDAAQLARIRSLSLDEVNQVAARYFRPQEMSAVVVGPLETIRSHAPEQGITACTPLP